jgi:hypothetical protein
MACWCKGNCPHIAEPKKLAAENKPQLAIGALHAALVAAPFCVEANIMLADSLGSTNQACFAKIHLDRAARAGMTPRLQLEIAGNLRNQGKVPEAIEAYRLATIALPKIPRAWGGYIAALEAAGELETAADVIKEASARFPDLPPPIRRGAAMVMAASNNLAIAVQMLEKSDITPLELLDRGRFKESLADYAGAWSDWSLAKQTLREKQGHSYWREHFLQLFAGMYEISQPGWSKLITPAPPPDLSPSPLFVTGFPRSGTTMIETALSQHSAIIAGDELMCLNDVIHSLQGFTRSPVPYPHAMLATAMGDNVVTASLLRDLYLRKAQFKIGFGFGRRPKAPAYFTDKMPLNEIHLPLIRMILPAAPVVILRRHPLDVIVSTMSNMLAQGGHYAASLETLAEHIAGVDSLLQHYKSVAGLYGAVECRYENFVADPAAELARILPAPLKVEPACVAFHENPRHARTISYRQVKTPLYKTSVARYKNFLPYLAPILPVIQPICEREGYEI